MLWNVLIEAPTSHRVVSPLDLRVQLFCDHQRVWICGDDLSRKYLLGSTISEEVQHPCALRHYFYIPRPRSHIKLYIEYDFNYMKGARMSYLLWYHIVVFETWLSGLAGFIVASIVYKYGHLSCVHECVRHNAI